MSEPRHPAAANEKGTIASDGRRASAAAVRVRHLHKRFGDVIAVEDVSLSVAAGEVFGMLGPNGAGKTTTIECVAGALAPDSGAVEVLGVNPVRDRRLIREQVGYQMQASSLSPMIRVGEAMRLFASFYRRPASVPELLRDVGLSSVARRRFGNLSGGQRQRLSIALALVGGPEVVILDELTTGLDPQGRRDIWRIIEDIRARGVTVLLVSHDLVEVERLCDRLAIISAGRSCFVGTTAELCSRSDGKAETSNGHALEDAYLALLDEVARGRESPGR